MKKLMLIPFVICMFSCSDNVYESRDHLPYVKYEVTGSTPTASITIEKEGVTQYVAPVLPWVFQLRKDGFVYVSAQNHESLGDVTVTIYVKNDANDSYSIYKTDSSSNPYGIATAHGEI